MVATTRRRARARAGTLTSGCEPACIEKLNDELLLHIFDILKHDSKPALLAATVVSSGWHALAQRVIDGAIGPVIISPKMADSNAKLFGRLKRDAGFRQRILHLSIGEWYLADMETHEPDVVPREVIGESPYGAAGYFADSWSEATRENDVTWTQVKQLTDAVSRLQLLTFSWKASPSIPRNLAEALARKEQCSVSIAQSVFAIEYAKFCYAPYANTWSLKSLELVSQNLTTLHALLPAADDQLLQGVGRLVWMSTALRELRINAIGCLWTAVTVPYELRGTELGKLATITNLDWLYRPYAVGSTNLLRCSTLELSNVCACSSTVDPMWTESVDWNRLESLTLTCVTLLRLVRGRVSRLTSLRFTNPTDRSCEHILCASRIPPEEVTNILQGFTSLRHLEIVNGTEIITPALLKSTGGHLQSLTIHDRIQTRWEPASARPLLDGGTIECIGCHCAKLSHLAIDVPHSDSPYISFLDNVAHKIPNLSSLAVYREVEVPGSDLADPPRSAVTLSSVQKDFAHLRQKMNRLVQFDVHVTSMPPFHLDKRLHRRSNGLALYQRHLRADVARKDCGSHQCTLQTRSIGVVRSAEAVSHAAPGRSLKHWESQLQWHEYVSKNAYDFHWKPPQPY